MYRSLFTHITEGFALGEVLCKDDGTPCDFRFLEVNEAFERQSGLTRDILGKPMREVLPNLESYWVETYCGVALGGEAVRFENYNRDTDRWYEVYCYPTEPGRFAILFRDVTAPREARVAMARANERLILLADVAGELLRSASPQLVVEDLCRRVMQFLDCQAFFNFLVDGPTGRLGLNACAGVPAAEVDRLRWLDGGPSVCGCVAHSGEPLVVEDVQAATTRETELIRSLGMQAYACHPLLAQGGILGTLSFGTRTRTRFSGEDLSLMKAVSHHVAIAMERQRSEQALRDGEERYRTLFTSIDEGFCIAEAILDDSGKGVDHRFLEVNPAFERHTGLVDAVGKTAREMVPDLEPRWPAIYGRIATTGIPERFIDESVAMGRWFEVDAFPVGRPEERKVAILFNDISARKRAEIALSESQAKLAAALSSMSDAVLITDADGRFLDINEGFAVFHRFRDREEWAHTLAGCPDLVEVFLPDGTLAPMDQWAVPRALRGEMGSNVEYTLRRKDTGDTWVGSYAFGPIRNEDGAIVGSVVVARDITDRKRAEAQMLAWNETLEERVRLRTAELERSQEALRQSERLAAIGQMMTGLSHESRNALQRSLAGVEMLSRRVQDQPALQSLVAEVRKANVELVRVYEGVQDYARPLVLKPVRMDLAQVWRDAWRKLTAREGRQATLVEDLGGRPGICQVDPVLFEQVFRNLFDNALAASPDPVEVRIALDGCHSPDCPGLRVRVRDNGPGLPPEVRARAFQPFVTTKTKGTGLGLAIVKRIVEAHGGAVALGPESGGGLEVVIDLPGAAHAQPGPDEA